MDAEKDLMKKLFGTDGIRGVAGEFPSTRPPSMPSAVPGASPLRRSPRVVIGQDTRESTAGSPKPWPRAGCRRRAVESAGVITTPGVAYLTRTHGFAAGIVISASHNPWQDNGIKLFGPDGMKLADAIEHEIEAEIFDHLESPTATDNGQPDDSLPGGTRPLAPSTGGSPVDAPVSLRGARPDRLRQRRRQCGRARALRRTRRTGRMHSHSPNGRNINDSCGALHPEHVAAEVRRAQPRSASPSTATPTAPFLRTPTATSSTATPCSCSPRAT